MDVPTITETGLYNYLLQKNIPGVREKVARISFKKAAQLYGTTQRVTPVYEIVSGAVKLGRLSPEGKECVYEILVPGEVFGNLSYLNNPGDPPFSEFSKALTATELYAYDLQFFKHLLSQEPAIAEWFYPKIIYRWNKTESLLFYIRSFEPRKRIQLLHASLHKKIMTALQREVFLDKLVSYKDLADLTATTRQLVAETIKSSKPLKA